MTASNTPMRRLNAVQKDSNDCSIPLTPLQSSSSSRRHFSHFWARQSTAETRLQTYQRRWGKIGEQLPAQINRRHISVISIGGAIGTGLYIGTATALRHAGPLGTLLGYTITGTVVWAVVTSIGEMVSFLPNVGGPVGLASLYVDPALGFALGWNAWYNWTMILPTELSAAALLVNGFLPEWSSDFLLKKSDLISISLLLVAAIGINCFGSKGYGEAEFIFSCIKIVTIVGLIIAGIVIDAGGGRGGPIGFRYWREPGPFVPYRAKGTTGKFLGVWASINQAVFAFFGTEVPGIAAREVQNPVKNIPRAVNRVWIRITLFYILAVFVAGLLVSSKDPRLLNTGNGNAGADMVYQSPFVIAMGDSGVKHLDKVANGAFVLSAFSAATSDVYISSRFLFYLAQCGHAPGFCGRIYKSKDGKTVVPWVGLLVAASFALLSFMSTSSTSEAFHWLSSITSTAALLAWIGMLYTYLRWYQGTSYAERQDPGFKKRNAECLYKNRHRWQPWVAWYAFIMCIAVIVFNGWFVFTRPGPWRIAAEPGDGTVPQDSDIGDWVPTFVSSYIALPLFLLLVLGYKLIYQTRMVKVQDMSFNRGEIPVIPEDEPNTIWGRLLAILF